MNKYFFYLILLSLFSCQEPAGVEATRFESTLPFYAVELNSVFDVYLVQDTVFGVRIEGNEKTINQVTLNLDTGILRIRNESALKWTRPEKNKVKLFIHADRLSLLLPNETCYIKTVTPIVADHFQIIMGHHPKLSVIDLELNCSSFFYWNNHQCGGKVTLRGKTDILSLSVFALMTVDATALSSSNAVIENNSKGDCSVYVQDKIEYSIGGVGNIYLYGDPEEIIPLDLTSTGKLIQVK